MITDYEPVVGDIVGVGSPYATSHQQLVFRVRRVYDVFHGSHNMPSSSHQVVDCITLEYKYTNQAILYTVGADCIYFIRKATKDELALLVERGLRDEY